MFTFDAPVPTTGTSRNKLKHVEPIRVQNFDRKLRKKRYGKRGFGVPSNIRFHYPLPFFEWKRRRGKRRRPWGTFWGEMLGGGQKVKFANCVKTKSYKSRSLPKQIGKSFKIIKVGNFCTVPLAKNVVRGERKKIDHSTWAHAYAAYAEECVREVNNPTRGGGKQVAHPTTN